MSVLTNPQPVPAEEPPARGRWASLRQHLHTGVERWRGQWQALLLILAVFLGFYYLPVGTPRFDAAVIEALELAKWYAQEHVILCLLPAFYIAGAIAVFVSGGSVMKYLGADAPKALAYGVASVSGRSSPSVRVRCCRSLPVSIAWGQDWGRRFRFFIPARPSTPWRLF